MVKKYLFNNKGVTLIEILAVVALLTVIGSASFPFITKVFRDYQEGIVRSSLFKEVQFIESQLIQVVRNSTNIPGENSYLKIDPINPDYYSFYSATDNTEKYAFKLDGNKLTYVNDSSSFILSDNVSSFSLNEEGTEVKKLIYTISLSKTDNGKNIEIKIENKYIYFPIWTF